MWLVKTFDDYEQYLQMFVGAKIVGSYKGLTFKKKILPMSAYYGMFVGDELVAYYWLVEFSTRNPRVLHGFELRVREDYQRRGIALTFYLEILLEDQYSVISDHSHSPESSAIWDKMQKMPELRVGMYDHYTDIITWGDVDKNKVYGNENMHLIVSAV
jgi:hypothetical protein